MTPTRERDVERYLVARAKAHGGEVRKVSWVGRRGAPDRLVMLPWCSGDPGAPCVWVEVKAPGKLATFPANAHDRQQHREHERMRRMGQTVLVVDSFETVDAALAS